MTRHIRGAAAISGIAAVLLIVGAQQLPVSYESTAVFSATDSGIPPGPARPEGTPEEQIRRIVEAPEQVVLLAQALKSEGAEDLAAAEKSARNATRVTTKPPASFAVSFLANTASGAQKGCSVLSSVLVKHFGAESSATGKAQAWGALGAAKKALDEFNAAHPTDIPKPSATVNASASDVAVGNLRKERAGIEAQLAQVQNEATSPVNRDNPYADTAPSHPDVAQLQRRLVEIRNAIAAAQKAGERDLQAAKARSDAASAEIVKTSAERERLALAVTQATKTASAASVTPVALPTVQLKLVEPPALPERPARSARLAASLLSIPLGLLVGAAYAFAMTKVRRRRRLTPPITSSMPPPLGTFPPEPALNPVPPPPVVASEPRLPAASPYPQPQPPQPPQPQRGANADDVVIPPPPAVPSFGISASRTQIGMVDPAAFVASTGSGTRPAAGGAGPSPPPAAPRLEPLRTVNLTSGSQPTAQAGAARPSNKATAPQGSGATALQGANAPQGANVPQGANAPQGSNAPQGANAPRGPLPSRPPEPGNPRSPVPPPPPRGRMSSFPPAPRPSVSPDANPSTRRLGSQGLSNPPAARSVPPHDDGVAMYRPDTTYSFVDRSSRSPKRSEHPTSPSASPGPDHVLQRPDLGPTRTEPIRTQNVRPEQPRVDPVRSEPVRFEPPAPVESAPPRQESIRPSPSHVVSASVTVERAPYTGSSALTRPGWSPVPEAFAGDSAPQLERSHGASAVEVRPAPASWYPGPGLEDASDSPELVALRDQLLEQGRSRSFVVGVTGEFDTGIEPKSRIATRLSSMLAADGRVRVLLLEADFDHPLVHDLTGVEMPRGAGFSQQIRSRIRAPESPKRWVVVRCSSTLDVMAEGVLRSPGVLFSREFSQAVEELRNAYDFIVADAPLVGAGSDHKPVDAVADGLVVVARAGADLATTLDRSVAWFKTKGMVAAVHAEPSPGARANRR